MSATRKVRDLKPGDRIGEARLWYTIDSEPFGAEHDANQTFGLAVRIIWADGGTGKRYWPQAEIDTELPLFEASS